MYVCSTVFQHINIMFVNLNNPKNVLGVRLFNIESKNVMFYSFLKKLRITYTLFASHNGAKNVQIWVTFCLSFFKRWAKMELELA